MGGQRSFVVRGARFGPIAVAVLTLALLLPAGSIGAPPPPSLLAHGVPGQTSTAPATIFPSPIRHVIVVVLENTPATLAYQVPYLASLASAYASTSDYTSIVGSSLPNYIAVTSGVANYPGNVIAVPNIGDQTEQAGMSWAGYFQSMSSPCDVTAAGYYYPEHNPFLDYKDIIGNQSRCQAHDLPLTDWNSALANGTVPNYALVVPDLFNDSTDSNLTVAASWLDGWLAPLLRSSTYGSSAIFITFDEGSSSQARVATILVSPYARPGFVDASANGPVNLWTTTQWLLLSAASQVNNASWALYPPMTDLFNMSRPSYYPVTGRVLTPSDRPVVGALVGDAANVSLDSGSYNTTNATGEFILELPSGRYSLTATAPGYLSSTSSHPIVVNGSQSYRYDFRNFTPVWTTSVSAVAFSPPLVDVGQAVQLAVSVVPSNGPLHFLWLGLPPGCATRNASTLPCRPSAAGSYPISVAISDPDRTNVTIGPASLTVFAALSSGRPTLTVPGLEIGIPATFVANLAGGSGGFSYVWSGLPPGCISENTPQLECTPSSTGSYSVTLTATDSTQASATSLPIVGTVAPQLALALYTTASEVSAGSAVRWAVTVTGGVAPYRFAWTGLPAGCTASNGSALGCAPKSSGAYTIHLTVSDAVGVLANVTAPLAVTGSSATLPFGLSQTDGLVLILGGLLVVAGLAYTVWYRRRERALPP